MAYSNITYPTLPEWDQNAYPYYAIGIGYLKDDDDWWMVSLNYSDTTFGCSGNRLYVNGLGYNRYIVWGNETWMPEMEHSDGESILDLGLVEGIYTRVWANHDIYDDDGNRRIKAGEWSGKTREKVLEYLRGLVIGVASKPVPFGGVNDGDD